MGGGQATCWWRCLRKYGWVCAKCRKSGGSWSRHSHSTRNRRRRHRHLLPTKNWCVIPRAATQFGLLSCLGDHCASFQMLGSRVGRQIHKKSETLFKRALFPSNTNLKTWEMMIMINALVRFQQLTVLLVKLLEELPRWKQRKRLL